MTFSLAKKLLFSILKFYYYYYNDIDIAIFSFYAKWKLDFFKNFIIILFKYFLNCFNFKHFNL